MTIRIATDSTCDLPGEIIARHRIAVVPLYIQVGDKSYTDGIDLSRRAFYEQLPQYNPPPTTAVPGPDVFRQAYERLAADGANEVISIHIASRLSTMVNVAQAAAQATDALPVTVFDSGQITLGTGLLVLAAAEAAAAGRSLQEILALLAEKAARIYSFAALDTLEFLRRGGRVSTLRFGLGTLLKIKPLLTMHDGEMSMHAVRTRKRALEQLVHLANELAPLEQLAVVHARAVQRLKTLRQQVQHLAPPGRAVLSAEVTPVIGTHVGPGAVGLVCVKAPG